MTNYVSRFIPEYSTITKPLRNLTQKDVRWSWTEDHKTAFENLKSLISGDKVMKYFDPDLPTEITVDASPFGLGATLAQRSGDKLSHIVSYASRALSDVESRYSQTEREALAVVWACEHFHLYVAGTHFTIISDHKP